MSILITPTLLNSFDFYCNVRSNTWKQKAFDDLLGTLRRNKPWEPSDAIKAGMQFEKQVYEQCAMRVKGRIVKGTELFNRVVDKCAGGEFQRKSKYYVTLAGMEFCVYSKLDVVFEKGSPEHENGHIIDIKTTGEMDPKYGRKKYLEGWQHKVYCVSLGIPTFEYLVAEWQSKTEFKLANIHSILVKHDDLNVVKEEINKHILKFVAWTKQNENSFGTYTALTTIFSQY